MTDDAGSVIWRMDYYPFGGERSVTGTGSDYNYEGHERTWRSDFGTIRLASLTRTASRVTSYSSLYPKSQVIPS